MKIIKKSKLIYCLSNFLILLLLGKIVSAQELFKFFEFVPRSQEKITISKNVIEESFIPFNDFLSGFNLFVNNLKVKDLDITILDKNNQVFWQKKIGIPIINGGWWGREYFIPLGDNYQINSGDEYKLIIKGNSASSSMDIFVKDVLEMLQGTESYLYFPENLKNLKIDGKETNYALKLAFYENKETIPPIISNFRLEIIDNQTVNILFNSNEPIIYLLKYKSNLDFSTSTFEINYFENCPYKVKDCQILLTVFPEREYNFLLEVYDYWQNKTEKEGSFKISGATTENRSQKSSMTEEKSFNQNQVSEVGQPIKNQRSINNLDQTNKNSADFLKNLNISKNSLKESVDIKKEKISLKPETAKEQSNKFLESEIGGTTTEEVNGLIKDTKKINTNQTLTSSKETELLNHSGQSRMIKFYLIIFIVFIFLLLFVFLLKSFKK